MNTGSSIATGMMTAMMRGMSNSDERIILFLMISSNSFPRWPLF